MSVNAHDSDTLVEIAKAYELSGDMESANNCYNRGTLFHTMIQLQVINFTRQTKQKPKIRKLREVIESSDHESESEYDNNQSEIEGNITEVETEGPKYSRKYRKADESHDNHIDLISLEIENKNAYRVLLDSFPFVGQRMKYATFISKSVFLTHRFKHFRRDLVDLRKLDKGIQNQTIQFNSTYKQPQQNQLIVCRLTFQKFSRA